MRNYETIILFRTDAPEATVSTITKKLEKIITKKPGKLTKKDDWGVKTLAYIVKKEKQARYIIWYYTQDPKITTEVDKALRFEESILRYATLVADEGLEKHLQEKSAKKAAAKEPTDEEKSERNNRDSNDVYVDYKDVLTLSRYTSERGKITPRRISGVNAKSQRRISQAVKRARQIAILSYTDSVFTERPQFDRGERGERGERGDRGDRGGDRNFERSDRSFDRHDRQ